MKKKPKTLPFELHDPKLPPYGGQAQPLDLSDESRPTAQCVLPQQTAPEETQIIQPPQLW